jgi:NNP family nitrate/nitrite transporter-like MFS transporter
MLGLIFTSALGNGSVVVSMTKVFPRTYTHRVLIWAGTIAMLGAVYLPLRFAWALQSQNMDTVYIDFIVFYVIGLLLNGFVYLRRRGQFYNP